MSVIVVVYFFVLELSFNYSLGYLRDQNAYCIQERARKLYRLALKVNAQESNEPKKYQPEFKQREQGQDHEFFFLDFDLFREVQVELLHILLIEGDGLYLLVQLLLLFLNALKILFML